MSQHHWPTCWALCRSSSSSLVTWKEHTRARLFFGTIPIQGDTPFLHPVSASLQCRRSRCRSSSKWWLKNYLPANSILHIIWKVQETLKHSRPPLNIHMLGLSWIPKYLGFPPQYPPTKLFLQSLPLSFNYGKPGKLLLFRFQNCWEASPWHSTGMLGFLLLNENIGLHSQKI